MFTKNVESRKVCNALTVNSFFVTKKTLFLLQSRTSQSVSFVNKHVSAVSSVSVFAAVLICNVRVVLCIPVYSDTQIHESNMRRDSRQH